MSPYKMRWRTVTTMWGITMRPRAGSATWNTKCQWPNFSPCWGTSGTRWKQHEVPVLKRHKRALFCSLFQVSGRWSEDGRPPQQVVQGRHYHDCYLKPPEVFLLMAAKCQDVLIFFMIPFWFQIHCSQPHTKKINTLTSKLPTSVVELRMSLMCSIVFI